MSAFESYDTTKLLNNLNVTNWDHHLREKLSAYPIMGTAIREGIPHEANKPTLSSTMVQGCIRIVRTPQILTSRVAKTS